MFQVEGSMKGFFKCVQIIAVLVCVSAASVLAISTDLFASSPVSWVGRPTIGLYQYNVSSIPTGVETCSTSILPLFVEGESGVREACVYGQGSGLRVARYMNANGQISYAVAYPTDSRFIPVRGLCAAMMRCVYSQAEDTLILESSISPSENGTMLVKGFSSRLVRHSDSGRYYTLSTPSSSRFLGASPQHHFSTGSVSISANGHWGLVELKGYGVARVNLITGEYKRIALASSGIMLTGSLLEMTITDDGKNVALAGRGVGLFIYEVTDACGDMPGEAVVPTILPGHVQCLYTTVSSTISTPRFQRVSMPRFSQNGERLQAYGVTSAGTLALSMSPSRTDLPVNPLYIAFGDSFTSGEGELDDAYYGDTNTTQNHCHNSSRSYPFLIGDYWSIPTMSVACSGSRTHDVVSAGVKLLQDNPLLSPTVVSVGIGGNDVDLVGKLKSCLGPGTCEWAKPDKRAATAAEIRSILPRVADSLNETSKDFAGPPILVMGYPTIIDPEDNASCRPLVSALLDSQERRYMHETILYLNTILKQAASYARAYYIDTSHAFEGERLCEGEELAMNSIRFGDDLAPIPQLGGLKLIGAESFHPKPYGHSRILSSSLNQLEKFWQNPHCNLCWPDERQLTPDSYWNASVDGAWGQRRQLSAELLKDNSLISGASVAFQLLAGTFAPDSDVILELHSQTVNLGSYKATGNGSLAGSITIPIEMNGYHTLHALGESISGEQIDLYQTIYIEGEFAPTQLYSVASKLKGDGLIATSSFSPATDVNKETQSVNGKSGNALGLQVSNHNDVKHRILTSHKRDSTVMHWLFWPLLALVLFIICLAVITYRKLKHRQTIPSPGD